MCNESLITSSKPEQPTILAYRVRVSGNTVAAFNNYDDATEFAKPLMHELSVVEIALSETAI